MNIEQRMKAKLDGWFYSFDRDFGKVNGCKVPLDFIPKHVPVSIEDDDGKPHPNTRGWSEAEDDRIMSMREAGNSYQAIARDIKRDVGLVRMRYVELCKQAGITPRLESVQKRYSKEQADKVLELRARGMPFEEIGKQVGMTKQQATDFYQRIKSRALARAAA